MANRKKLSEKKIKTIEDIIIALGGNETLSKGDEALSKKATKLVVNYYKRMIEQGQRSDKYTKSIIIKTDNKGVIKTVKYEKNNKKIENIFIKNNSKTLENLIDNQRINVSGISVETCKRFRRGENIDSEVFDILCETLDVIPENVCHKEPSQETLEQADKLNIALCRFNYQHEELSFRPRKNSHSYHCLYLYKTTVNHYSCHWLLKSLIIEEIDQREDCNHHIIRLNLLTISSKSKNSVGDKLLLQIRDNLQKFFLSKLKIKISRDSTISDLAEALNKILQQQSIILLVEISDNIGLINEQIVIQQFWQPLIKYINSKNYHLFLCFHGFKKPEYQSNIYDFSFKVGKCFNQEYLRNWFNNSRYNRLFEQLTSPNKIQEEVNSIWEECQEGKNDLLLKAIHSSCDCKIEEPLWQKI